jgi:tetratricopeptide (TPR) repeat protein
LLSVWDKQFPFVLGCGAAVVLGGFVVARIIFRRLPDSYSITAKPSLGVAPTEEKKGAITPACLQAIESSLRAADVPDPLIPSRLRDASECLARLRARLVKVKPDAVPLIDCGDFDAAVALLKQSCEPDSDLDEGCLESDQAHQMAEIYADAALLDQLKLDYRSAAENFAAAATLVSRFGDPASKDQEKWHLRIEQGNALVDDGLQTGDGGSFISAIATYDQALSLAPRRQAPLNWAPRNFIAATRCWASGANDNEAERFEEAVESFRAALEEWIPQPAPFDWARAHNITLAKRCNGWPKSSLGPNGCSPPSKLIVPPCENGPQRRRQISLRWPKAISATLSRSWACWPQTKPSFARRLMLIAPRLGKCAARWRQKNGR